MLSTLAGRPPCAAAIRRINGLGRTLSCRAHSCLLVVGRCRNAPDLPRVPRAAWCLRPFGFRADRRGHNHPCERDSDLGRRGTVPISECLKRTVIARRSPARIRIRWNRQRIMSLLSRCGTAQRTVANPNIWPPGDVQTRRMLRMAARRDAPGSERWPSPSEPSAGA